MADPWDAFGDDSDDSDDDNQMGSLPLVQAGVAFLTQEFVKHNLQIGLKQRIVATTDADWEQTLTERGVQVDQHSSGLCDAAIFNDDDDESKAASLRHRVVPGGHLLVTVLASQQNSPHSQLDQAVWSAPQLVYDHDERSLWAVQRWPCPVNQMSCPWKSNQPGELSLLHKATITRSAHEIRQQQTSNSSVRLTSQSVSSAAEALQECGYCIVRNLLDTTKCREWGQAVMTDLKAASQILLERDEIDLYHPHDSKNDPQSYRELSMREDLRMDLRDGPQIRRLRSKERSECGLPMNESESHAPTIFNSGHEESSTGASCLRYHPDVIRIVQQTLNPKDPALYKGNFGRYNFEGSGPDGSPQSLRIGPMGGIVSLPKSADQAIHADTPHLFETHDCLPAHYVNAFCLGADIPCEKDDDGLSTGATAVGGTAFVHASHKLSFTAALAEDWSVTTEPKVLQNLIRPSLAIGDLVLFDCRILHFGLANTSSDIERPMLYTNMTQAWFHDPKNWDNQEAIFAST